MRTSTYLFTMSGLLAFGGVVFAVVPDVGWSVFAFSVAAIGFLAGVHVQRRGQ